MPTGRRNKEASHGGCLHCLPPVPGRRSASVGRTQGHSRTHPAPRLTQQVLPTMFLGHLLPICGCPEKPTQEMPPSCSSSVDIKHMPSSPSPPTVPALRYSGRGCVHSMCLAGSRSALGCPQPPVPAGAAAIGPHGEKLGAGRQHARGRASGAFLRQSFHMVGFAINFECLCGPIKSPVVGDREHELRKLVAKTG